MMKEQLAFDLVKTELNFAKNEFPEFRSAHEGAAIIREEFDEFWAEVKCNNDDLAKSEAIQLAAMAIRFLMDIPND